MGKNFKGGNKQKSLPNKDQLDDLLRVPDGEFEKYAIVTKVLGSGMFQVIYFENENDNQGKTLLAHLRGNMKGKMKRFNLVYLHSFIIIQLRPYETFYKNSDILHVYSNNQIQNLPNHLTNYLNHIQTF